VRCLATLEACEPLTAPEPDRPSFAAASAVPLHRIERDGG